MNGIIFTDPKLAQKVEHLSQEERDALPFGAIRLSRDGIIESMNLTERAQSGFGARPALGRYFFTEIAPCMNTPDMKGRIDAASATGEIDIELGWIGDFADRNRELIIRCLSAPGGGLWVFLNRDPA